MISDGDLTKALQEAKKSKKRNFTQRIEFIVNFKDIDLKNPQNRIKTEMTLPNPAGKDIKIAFFAEQDMVKKAQEANVDKVITKKELDELAKDPKLAKKLADEYEFFLAQSTLMVQIGKTLGRVLGPRGKMPKPVPPAADPTGLVNKYKKSIYVNMKDAPQVQIPVGNDKNKDSEIVENIQSVLKNLEHEKLFERGVDSFIRSMYIKTSMGQAIRV